MSDRSAAVEFRDLGMAEGTGAAPPEYEHAGQAAYLAFVIARGSHDEPPWSSLVWADQYAWCEAARAARSFT